MSLTDRLSFSDVRPGTYTVALRAVNAFGSSGPSNTVTLTFPAACTPPATPTNLSVSKSGHTIVVSWSLPEGGGAPTGYVVHLASESMDVLVPAPGMALSGAVGPDTVHAERRGHQCVWNERADAGTDDTCSMTRSCTRMALPAGGPTVLRFCPPD